jgi:hypothetical protein
MHPTLCSVVVAEQLVGAAVDHEATLVHDPSHSLSLSDANTIAASQFVLPQSLVESKSVWAAVLSALLAFHHISRTFRHDDANEKSSFLRFALVQQQCAARWIPDDDAASLTELQLLQRFASLLTSSSSSSPSPSSTTSSTSSIRVALESAVSRAINDIANRSSADALVSDVVLDFVLVLQSPAPTAGSRFASPDTPAVDLRAVVADAILAAVPPALTSRIVSCRFTLLRAVGSAVNAPSVPDFADAPLPLDARLPPLLCAHWSAAPAFLVNVMSTMATERHGGTVLRVRGASRNDALLHCGDGAPIALALARANVAALSVCGAETSQAWRPNGSLVLSSHLVALHVADAMPITALLSRASLRNDGRICMYSDNESVVTHVLQVTPLGQLVLQALAPSFADHDDADELDSSETDATKLVRVSALRELVCAARLKRPGGAPTAPSDTGVMYVDNEQADAGGVLPRVIERRTRYFPLSESRTLLFNSRLHDDLRAVVAPVVQAARSATVSDELLSACVGAIQRLHVLCEQNDGRYFLALGDTARVRREAYVAFWVELRTLLQLGTTTPRHVQLVQQMETLWPAVSALTTHDASLPMLADLMARTALSMANASVLTSTAVMSPDGATSKSAARAAAAEREALASGKVRVKQVRRQPDGKPVLPVLAKGAMVQWLGTVVHDRSLFHNEKYIWPVGFRSVRELPSLLDPGRVKVTKYTSEIVDGGKQPLFRVTPADAPGEAVVHTAPSGCWRIMLGRIKQRKDVSVSGPEMFGFSDSTIRMLIQELPNARSCVRYLWLDFEQAIEMQEERRREHERIAQQLDSNHVDDSHHESSALSASSGAVGSTPQRRAAKTNDSEAHLWRLYDEARSNAERDSLRAEYDRQSLATARDFDAAPEQPDIVFAPSKLQMANSSSVLSQFFTSAAKRRRTTPLKAPFGDV